MEPLKVIVIGAGGRGCCYTNIMHKYPDKFKVVGVAEPIDDRRNYIKEFHGVPEENCHLTWETILNVPKFADIAIISTMDQLHTAPALKALELGYDLLLEKPVAPTPEECGMIYNKAKEMNAKVMVCHVLRYTLFYKRLKEILDEGTIGDIISVEHIEAVGNIHQSHSFVRGNWGNSGRSSFMLLQKCCHDLDILQWLLDKKCSKIQSFGSLKYFKRENAPAGSPERCHEGCPVGDTCYYNAMKLYYDDKGNGWFRGSACGTAKNPDDEKVMEALKTTQYGKCIFKCDNDVVDHQIVNMEFDDDTTVSMTMCAFTKGGRKTHFMGTKGELWVNNEARSDDEKFIFYSFDTHSYEALPAQGSIAGNSIIEGHGGGDSGIVDALYKYETGEYTAEQVSEIGISCSNHLLVFAAEQSRTEGSIVDIDEYSKNYMK